MAQSFGEQSRIPLIGEAEILKSIINTLADGVVVADCEGRFIFFNSTAQSILGIGSIDASADRWSDIYGCYRPDRITPYPSRELPLARALAGETVPAAPTSPATSASRAPTRATPTTCCARSATM